MTPPQTINLVPSGQNTFRPLIDTEKAYRQFCTEFTESVKPALSEHAAKRRKSEEAARKRWIS